MGSAALRLSEYTSAILCWFAIGLWNLLIAIDATSLSTALPSIAAELHADSAQAFWFATSFLLLAVATQPVYTNLSGAFGRKPVVQLSLFLFTVGIAVSGWATTVPVMLVGRCVQGAGAGGLRALTFVLLSDLAPLQDRGKYVSMIGVAFSVGICIGPVIGGLLVHATTWRWLFWFNLPLCGLCAIFVALFHSSKLPKPELTNALRRIDYFGIISFVSSLTCVLFALSAGGMLYAWTDAGVFLPLIVGVAGLLLWGVYSFCWTEMPILPVRALLVNRTNLITYLGTAVAGLIQTAVMFALPIYYQAVKGYNARESGLGLLPAAIVCGPGAVLSGMIVHRTRRVKRPVLFSWALLAVGLSLLLLLGPDTTVPQWISILIPGGLAVGLLFAPMTLGVQAMTEELISGMETEAAKRIETAAAGLSPFFHTLGGALGIVVVQTVFSNEVKKFLSLSVSKDAIALTSRLRELPQSAAKTHLVQGLNQSLATVWVLLAALAGTWAIATLFTMDITLGDPVGSDQSRSPGQTKMDAELGLDSGRDSQESIWDLKSLECTDVAGSEVSVKDSGP